MPSTKVSTASSAEPTPMCLIQLKDRKSTYIMLVQPEVLDWIEQPFSPPNGARVGSYDEEVPANIRERYVRCHEESTCHVTIGSYDNDRALATLEMGESFDSIAQMMAYVQRNNMCIAGEYDGVVY